MLMSHLRTTDGRTEREDRARILKQNSQLKEASKTRQVSVNFHNRYELSCAFSRCIDQFAFFHPPLSPCPCSTHPPSGEGPPFTTTL